MKKLKKLLKFIFYFLLLCTIVFAVGVLIPASKLPVVGSTDNVLIEKVTIVDVESGALIPRQNVLIRDGVITGISGRDIRPKDELIILVDGEGKFLIPGLWDMHTQSLKRSPHFHHPLFIANGVTHVRDLSGCLTTDDEYWACTQDRKRWTRQAERGETIAPLYHQNSTYPINGGNEVPETFPDYLRADSYEKGEALVKFNQSLDADFMVAGPSINKRAYLGLALEAALHDVALAGNKPINTSLFEALTTYQSSIDESWVFATECFANSQNYRDANDANAIYSVNTRRDIVINIDPALCSSLMVTMSESDTRWTPSLSQLKVSAFAGEPSFFKDEKNKYIPFVTRYLHWALERKKHGLTKDDNGSADHKDFYELIKQQVGLAHSFGVKILVGSDSNSPYVYSGFSLHEELDELVDAGFSNLQALRAATLQAASFSYQPDYGSIKTGKKADLVMLNANPLDSIRNTRRIEAVIVNQVYYDRDALDTLLEFTEKQAGSWHMNCKLVWDSLKSPLMRHQLKNDIKTVFNKD